MATRAIYSIHMGFSIVIMYCGVFQVPFLSMCCLYRSHLLNLSIVLFLAKAGVHCSFFVLGKEIRFSALFPVVCACREQLRHITQDELQPNSGRVAELVLIYEYSRCFLLFVLSVLRWIASEEILCYHCK